MSRSTSLSQVAVQVRRLVTLSPPLASRSSTGGSVPGFWNEPTLETKYAACLAAEPALVLGRAKW